MCGRQLSISCPTLTAAERAVALEAIDATMWQLMATLDGMNGGLQNERYQVNLHLLVQLQEQAGSEMRMVESLDVREGDGMCLGLSGWLEEDYGDYPVVAS
jgi:6-phosphofructokinase